MFTLERAQVIPRPREEVFRFFEDPRNLAEITPKEMGFEIVEIDELPVRPGFRIVYRIKWAGIGLKWVTTISEYDAPNGFADVQAKGPYKYWHHEHTFEDLGDGQTMMRDRVRYELPFGILGAVMHRLVVARQLRRIFDYRARQINTLFPPQASPATGISNPETAQTES